MREIKFRGKRVDNGEWVYGDLSRDQDLGTAYIQGWDYYSSDSGLQREPYIYQIDPSTVGQYTGREKIYENDIVMVYDELHKRHFKGVVKYTDCSFYIDNTIMLHFRWQDYEVEVVGNIHDNPEILKE